MVLEVLELSNGGNVNESELLRIRRPQNPNTKLLSKQVKGRQDHASRNLD